MTLAAKIIFIAALTLSIILPFSYFLLGERCKKRYKRTLGVNTVFFDGHAATFMPSWQKNEIWYIRRMDRIPIPLN